MTTIERLEKLVYDYIAAQEKREAERAKADAERARAEAEDRAERARAEAEDRAERARINAEKAKADAEMKAAFEERWKRLEENLGHIGNSFGEQTEAMFTNLGEKFNAELGLDFPETVDRGRSFYGPDRKRVAQVDRYYENCDYIMATEVKAKLKEEHVDAHIERLEKIRALLDAKNDGRKLMGAVAGGIVPESVLNYAHDKGLYVLMQNGGAVSIAERPKSFKERTW